MNMYETGMLLTCVQKISKMISKNPCYKWEDVQKGYKLAKGIIEGSNNRKMFRMGNLKLEKNVFIWDLPSIITCACACKSCYALKPERIYPQSRWNRITNLILLEYAFNNISWYIDILNRMTSEIKKTCAKNPHVKYALRVHSSGDIYSNLYLKFLLQLADKLACVDNLNIYTYTKQLDNTAIDKINSSYNNFNIVKSKIYVDNRYYINFGPKEYIEKLASLLKDNNMLFYICDYGQEHAHTCMGTCHACLHNDVVLFVQH